MRRRLRLWLDWHRAARMFCTECGGPIVTRHGHGTCSAECWAAFEDDIALMR